MDEKLGKFRKVSSTAPSTSAVDKVIEDRDSTTDPIRDSLSSSDKENSLSGKQSSDSATNDDGSINQQSNSSPYIELYQESVNYLGYYSSHEQLMQQLILDKAHTTQLHIRDMVSKGM